MRRPPALVLVNPGAGGGRGPRRLAAAWPAVSARLDPRVVELDRDGRWRPALRDALTAGVRHFVAAGGDGTVGALANALWDSRDQAPLDVLTLGALGLGSSNDFHKPVRSRVAGVPARLGAASPRDVGRVRYQDESGGEQERIFLVSCSLGLTAAANAFFNEGDRWQRLLRRHWTGAAIVYSALRTILKGRGLAIRLRLAGHQETIRVASLSVTKTRYLAGVFAFDTPIRPDDGCLAVNLIEDRGRAASLAALCALARGHFTGRPGARHWSAAEVSVETEAPAPVEIDGEIVYARRVRFDLLPQRLRACA